jgi:hypothetical protein
MVVPKYEIESSNDVQSQCDDNTNVAIIEEKSSEPIKFKITKRKANELQEANKKIASFEQRETKQSELATCYICLSKIKWPLQICETGHFACADCLCKQSIAMGNVKYIPIGTGIIPKYHVNWQLRFRCGLCKKTADPKYPGPLVTQLIEIIPSQDVSNPKPNLICPTCNKNFSESLIGMHILQCHYNTMQCPLCFQNCKIRSLNYHIDHNCNLIPCKRCDFKSNHSQLKLHMIQHDLVDRSILAMHAMVANLSSDVGMKRAHLLLSAMTSMNDILVGQDTDCTMSTIDQVRHFLNDHEF